MVFNHRPEDWKYRLLQRTGNDTNKIFGIKYIGAQASGLITVAATTNDITLSHGVLASEVADATVGATGVLDLTVYTTPAILGREINSSPNWEFWGADLPPDYTLNFGAGTGIFLESAPWDAAVQAKVVAGVYPLMDTSKMVVETHGVGVTLNGPSSTIHNHDGSTRHDIMKIVATITYVGGTDGIYIFECDDVAGTKTQVDKLALVSATATTFGTGDTPMVSSDGKRLVVQAADVSGALTGTQLDVYTRSLVFGPSMNKNKRLSAY